MTTQHSARRSMSPIYRCFEFITECFDNCIYIFNISYSVSCLRALLIISLSLQHVVKLIVRRGRKRKYLLLLLVPLDPQGHVITENQLQILTALMRKREETFLFYDELKIKRFARYRLSNDDDYLLFVRLVICFASPHLALHVASDNLIGSLPC